MSVGNALHQLAEFNERLVRVLNHCHRPVELGESDDSWQQGGYQVPNRSAAVHGALSPVSTATATRSAASATGTCSQRRTTFHPSAFKEPVTRSSRARLRANFAGQYCGLVDGMRPCSGHPCQKHPSTNTATRARVKTTSTFTLVPSVARSMKSFRKRRPREWSAERSATSGFVSARRLPFMAAVMAGLLGCG